MDSIVSAVDVERSLQREFNDDDTDDDEEDDEIDDRNMTMITNRLDEGG